MTDERLAGLALMYIHPDVNMDVNEVITRFATSSSRIPFALQSSKRQVDDMEEGSASETDSNKCVRV